MRELMSWELCVTVNSDDPPFFSMGGGGYINENFEFWAEKLPLSVDQIYQLALNSVDASFLDSERKKALRARVEDARKQFDLKLSSA